MHDGNKHYIMMPRLPETNTSQQTRTNTMSVFRPVPEHQRHLYSVISTNSQNVSTPNPTNTQAGVQYGTKPQNTLRTTQSNALQSRSFLEKAGFTISEISSSSPLELVKEYVIEYDLKVNLDSLEAFYWKCLGSINFFAKASKTLRRPIIYFLGSSVMLFENGMRKESHNIMPFIAEKDNAIIVFQQASSVFYLVTPPNKQ